MYPLDLAHAHAREFLEGLAERRVGPRETPPALRDAFNRPMPEHPDDPIAVLEVLIRDAEPGIVSSAGPRYFGFVTGGSLPAALAADWLVSAWDQNAALNVMSPAVAAIEAVTARWLLELFGIPATASVGFVTGAHMANVTALASARHEVLRRAGWDVEANGLQGAPRVTVVAGADAHSSVPAAARMIGLGARTIVPVAADDQGRMRPEALDAVLRTIEGPVIVCAQAGNVNTGAVDPLGEIAPLVRARHGWLHVDGAFGLWAAVSPPLRHHVAGIERADSWTTDAHKWLNVPYDSGIVMVAHSAAHRAAMSQSAAYLIAGAGDDRDGMDWTPEASRRARAVPIHVVLRSLGRTGLAAIVEGCCRHAARIADRLRSAAGVHILNDVVLNQVLVRFDAPDGTNVTDAVIARIQAEGTCWCGGTRWRGVPAMRISISNWSTTAGDADRSADAMLDAHAAVTSA